MTLRSNDLPHGVSDRFREDDYAIRAFALGVYRGLHTGFAAPQPGRERRTSDPAILLERSAAMLRAD